MQGARALLDVKARRSGLHHSIGRVLLHGLAEDGGKKRRGAYETFAGNHGMNRRALLIALVVLAGCREVDAPGGVGGRGHLEIDSDPQGALISVDGKSRNKFTPDTIAGLRGRQTISVSIDSAGTTYGFRITTTFRPDSVVSLLGPLITSRCTGQVNCQPRDHDNGRIGFRRSPMGPLFHQSGQGNGLRWPLGTANSYASIGTPIMAALIQGADTIALGIYNREFMVGRPYPIVQADPFKLDQTIWIVPPENLVTRPFLVARGLEVREELMATSDLDVLLLRLTFTNITSRPSYRALDPLMPPSGVTLQQTWVGFALDPDIGDAGDDLFAYSPADNAILPMMRLSRRTGSRAGNRCVRGCSGCACSLPPPEQP